MRAFNDREKDIIRKLVNLREEYGGSMPDFLSSYVYGAQSGTALVVDNDAQELTVVSTADDFDERVDNEREEVENFYELLALVAYLKEERFISIFNLAKEQDCGVRILGAMPGKGQKSRSVAVGPNCYHLARENFLGEVYVSQDLRELVRDNFVGRDEMRFRRQHMVTWAALVVAIAVGIAGIALQIVMLFKSMN